MSVFVKVKLCVPDGGLVTYVETPNFQNWPEVICWGSRFFQLYGELEYREVCAYFIPPPHTADSGE